MTETAMRNISVIKDTLQHACEAGELLFLVTPYMRFESNFLRMDDEAFFVTALMSKEDATFGLRSPDLKIRFPFGHDFWEAPTRMLGIGMTRGRQSLKLAIPSTLVNSDYRGACRVEKVGRLPVTFSSRKYDLLMGTVINLSTTGVRIYTLRDFEDDEILVDDEIHIALNVDPKVNLNCKAKVRYVRDHILGVEFRPRPEGELLENFARWVFQKREEEQAQAAYRRENAAAAGIAVPAPLAEDGPPSLVLVGGTDAVAERLGGMLTDLPPLLRLHANIQSMKTLALTPRALVLFHVASTAAEDRKRLRFLVEALGGKLPFVLVGTGADPAVLAEMGNELKAISAYPLAPASGTFFPRLLQGILRRHFPES